MKYFTGSDLFGLVKLSTANTFRECVDRHVLIAVPINVSREEYQKLPKTEKDRVKSVAYLTPAEFATSPSKRKIEKAVKCNLLFLDIDPDKLTSKSEAAPWVANPDLLNEALAPFAFCAYHTASSTSAVPRVRIMVSAEAVPVDRYADAVRTIGRKLGIKVNTESCVPVQPMYLPTLFAGEGEEDHPMFASDMDGREFVTEDIDGVAHTPDAKLKTTSSAVADLLLFMRAPVDEITLETAASALDHIDPDCEYREWLDVAAALHHQFPRDEEKAYELFDVWSSKGSKYVSEEETRAKWDTFQHSPVGRLPKTMRTILQRAAVGGWDSKHVKEQGFQRVLSWLSSGVDTVSSLLSESLLRILATPLLSVSEQDALLHQIVLQAKKRFAVTVSVTSLRKDMQRLRDKADSEVKDGKVSIPPWLKGMCYVVSSDEFFKQRTSEKIKPQAFDRAFTRKLPATDDKTPITPCNYALNSIKLATVYGYDYNPAQSEEIFTSESGRVYVNTYRRSYPIPTPETADEAGLLFMRHLDLLIEEEAHRYILVDFFAYMVQHPGAKVRWAPFLQGVEGCGKSFFTDAMSAVLGKEHVLGLDAKSALSGWTEWSTGRQLVAIEEIRVAGTNRHEMMNILKPLITNTHYTVSQRFCDTRQVNNVTNYMVFSNHHDALALSPGDRRYFVLKSKIQTREQKPPTLHFDALYAMLRDNAGGLRSWFEQWQIDSGFSPDGAAPITKYLSQMVEDSANETMSSVRRLIREHDHPLIQRDVISAKVLHELLCNNEGINKVTPQHLASVLRDEGYVHTGRHSVGDGERHYLWKHNEATHIADIAETARVRMARGGGEHQVDLFF